MRIPPLSYELIGSDALLVDDFISKLLCAGRALLLIAHNALRASHLLCHTISKGFYSTVTRATEHLVGFVGQLGETTGACELEHMGAFVTSGIFAHCHALRVKTLAEQEFVPRRESKDTLAKVLI